MHHLRALPVQMMVAGQLQAFARWRPWNTSVPFAPPHLKVPHGSW